MRIDQALNKLCLAKTRSIAKKACDSNLVKVNGITAKASTVIKESDTVEYSLYGYVTTIKLIKVPAGNVSKKNAAEFYTLVSRNKVAEPDY